MTIDFKKKIQEASELAKDAPEQYQDIAFQVILEYLLHLNDEAKPVKHYIPTKIQQKSASGIDTILNSDFDWPSTKIPKLKPIEQNLYVLRIANDEFDMDWLSPQDIQIILSQKFRLTKSANAVSMSLMGAVGKYVDRRQQGKEYLYRITSSGRIFLDSLIQNMEKE